MNFIEVYTVLCWVTGTLAVPWIVRETIILSFEAADDWADRRAVNLVGNAIMRHELLRGKSIRNTIMLTEKVMQTRVIM